MTSSRESDDPVRRPLLPRALRVLVAPAADQLEIFDVAVRLEEPQRAVAGCGVVDGLVMDVVAIEVAV
jgi:hypothetical protein